MIETPEPDRAGDLRIWSRGEVVGTVDRLIRSLRSHLAAGGVLVIPTESSYGLAVDPRNAEAVRRIYQLKRRASDQPLPIVAADLDQIRDLGCRLPEEHGNADPEDRGAARLRDLMRRWPAPLSILFDFDRDLPAAAGCGKVAVRIPDFAPLRALLNRLGTALTATSANASGEPSFVDPAELVPWLGASPGGDEVLIVECGQLPGGPPSTLVQPNRTGYEILRRGAVSLASLKPAESSTKARLRTKSQR